MILSDRGAFHGILPKNAELGIGDHAIVDIIPGHFSGCLDIPDDIAAFEDVVAGVLGFHSASRAQQRDK